MSNHGYPRLCGGTFFTLTLQALKQRMGAREHYNSESDGMSDPEVLMGLFKVVNPDFQELDKKKLKGAADGFKSCKSKSSVYLPFGDTQEIRAFDKRVKTQYAEALHDMEAFVDEFIDIGEKVAKHVTLVRALADLVMKDDEIKPPLDEFYITLDGRTTKKAAFGDLDEVYLPAFLLGIWHYAVAVRKDNTVGDDTYNRWCPSAGGAPRIYQGDMGKDVLEGMRVITAKQQPPAYGADVVVEDDAPVIRGIPQPPPVQQVVTSPFIFNFTQNGSNNTQIGHVEHYHAGKKED